MSPGVTLQSKVDYGSPLWCYLPTPTKGALGQKPMSPLDSHTGHCVLHVPGTESCLVTVIQVCEASQAQHKMQSRDTYQEQGLEERWRQGALFQEGPMEELTFYSACFPGPSLLPKERTNQTDTCRKHFPMRVTCRWLGADSSHMTRQMDMPRSTGAGC